MFTSPEDHRCSLVTIEMLTLDYDNGLELEYLAEGGANVVYRICPSAPSPGMQVTELSDQEDNMTSEIQAPSMDPSLAGKLLRLSKDIPSRTSVLESQQQHMTHISPLLPDENLVQQDVVEITARLKQHCNEDLRRMECERTRPKNRTSVYLAEGEIHGLLVTDMSCSSIEDENFSCVEFKPKWLVQSASAPKTARRCRTCALRAMRRSNHVHSKDNVSDKRPEICPLALLSNDKDVVHKTAFEIASKGHHTSMENSLLDALTSFLYQNPVLSRLQDLQVELDPQSIFESDLQSFRFLAAMTLRDCTLFLKAR